MIIQFNIPIFKWDVIFTDNRKDYIEQCIKYKLDSDCKLCFGITNTCYPTRTMIVGVFDRTYQTIAHEVNHVVIRILEEMRTTIDDSTSEAFCCLHDYICEEIRKNKKNKIEVSSNE